MLSSQLATNHSVNIQAHSHDDHVLTHDHQHNHEAGQNQTANDNCSGCGHCIACFTVLPPSKLVKMQSQIQAPTNSLFEPSYLSHITAQPQRPPIS